VIAVTAAIFVVLDGFDFGAGALHLWVARSDRERREVLAAIGPLWDGNEVWLLATGTGLFLAFPRVLGSALSGFYLAIFMVIWVLILRGLGIELRSHVGDPMWRGFWDAVLAFASTLAPLLFGAALGNVVRGVPLDRSGWFSLPLFTDFRVSRSRGVLDWYTVLIGTSPRAAPGPSAPPSSPEDGGPRGAEPSRGRPAPAGPGPPLAAGNRRIHPGAS
jgi:cytochrome d ubiquinol oxidase subunit II